MGAGEFHSFRLFAEGVGENVPVPRRVEDAPGEYDCSFGGGEGMASINVGSVVMDARLDTSAFAKELSALGGLAKTGFAALAGEGAAIQVEPEIHMPDLSGMMESLVQAMTLTEVLTGAAEVLSVGLFGVSGAANVVSAAVQAGGISIGGMTDSAAGSIPVLDGLTAAQGNAAVEGARATGVLEACWNAFRGAALVAASDVAAGAAASSARASSTLSNMLDETSRTALTWQSTYNAGVLDANDVLVENIKSSWQNMAPFWQGVGKSIANGTIGTMNSMSSAVVRGVSGLVNMVGGALSSVGNLFGQNWGWSMPGTPPSIPFLARGGIVSQPTLAMIGERGTEAVLPLDRNTGWISALAEQIAAMGGQGGASAPASVNLYVDGRRLAEATISNFQSVASRRGIALAPGRG